jgi:hypothetical protein
MGKKYKPETEIVFVCNTGLAGCKHVEEYTLEDLGIDCSKSNKHIEEELDIQVNEWKDNFIEVSWKIKEEKMMNKWKKTELGYLLEIKSFFC